MHVDGCRPDAFYGEWVYFRSRCLDVVTLFIDVVVTIVKSESVILSGNKHDVAAIDVEDVVELYCHRRVVIWQYQLVGSHSDCQVNVFKVIILIYAPYHQSSHTDSH